MVLDWGIGGLPLFQNLVSSCPGASLLYLSDSGTVPYGKQSPGELQTRLGEIAVFAAGLGIKTIAVACNAMSSILSAPNTIIGNTEILSLIHTFLSSPPRGGHTVGIIGGIRTIQSGIYQRAFEAAGNRVRACPAQELSALIEAGDFERIPSFLEKLLSALGNIDELVLACTHYPAVSSIIKSMIPGLTIIDPGHALLDECIRRLSVQTGVCQKTPGGQTYITTGVPELSRLSAEKAFGFSGLPFQHIAADLAL
jgi:glutamate racemase